MTNLTVVKTFFSRFFILFLSFGLVIFTTNIWGSEGKGSIAMVIANVALVTFFTGIFTGSSTSYFTSKFKTEYVLPWSYLWAIGIGLLIPLFFGFAQLPIEYLPFVIAIAIMTALLNTNINIFIGRQNIKLYNTYTILQITTHAVLLLVFFFGFRHQEVSVYFVSQIISLLILFSTSFFQIIKHEHIRSLHFSKNVFKKMIDYGWKTQLSAFVQFLNYRLSFYFLDFYQGVAVVGVFSLGITFAEAIWTITRSMAVVLYSQVVNSTSAELSIEKTKSAVKVTFWLTVFFLAAVLLIPEEVYTWIFGKDFTNTRTLVLFLSPGILAIATSDMVGHYFSATKQLRILNLKSFLGLGVTLLMSFLLIPKYGIYGACVATSFSYLASAGLLYYAFFKETDFKVKDYLLSLTDIKKLGNSIFKA